MSSDSEAGTGGGPVIFSRIGGEGWQVVGLRCGSGKGGGDVGGSRRCGSGCAR